MQVFKLLEDIQSNLADEAIHIKTNEDIFKAIANYVEKK